MTGLDSVYRQDDGHVLIELNLSSVSQLFNSFDPAPFHEKEIDSYAEKYIVDVVSDFPRRTKFRIIVYLPDAFAGTKEAQDIPKAIRRHFEYRALIQNHKYRDRSVYGKFTIIVGLTFLAIAIIASNAVAEHFPDSPTAQLIATALMVAGWVAMWEPVTVHLYQLWPIIQQRRLYERISAMDIEVLAHSCSSSQENLRACLLKR